MESFRKWAIRFIAAVTVIMVVGFSVICYQVSQQLTPSVPLTSGLSGKWAEASAQFDGRIKKAFPLGSSATLMEAALRREGFTPPEVWSGPIGIDAAAQHQGKPKNPAHRVTRTEKRLVCVVGASVYWRADKTGNIISVRGEYGEAGCL